jgi:hypothetical protein
MTNLTRRRLLKFIGIGALATVVPISKQTVKAGPLTDQDRIPIEDVSVPSQKVKFNPNFEYGRAAECNGLKDSFVIRHLHRDAKKVLPKGVPYELRLIIPSFVEHPEWGSRPMMAWYYFPDMLREKAKDMRPDSWGEWSPRYGCWIRGKFYA